MVAKSTMDVSLVKPLVSAVVSYGLDAYWLGAPMSRAGAFAGATAVGVFAGAIVGAYIPDYSMGNGMSQMAKE